MIKMTSRVYYSTIHTQINFLKTLSRDKFFVLIATNPLFENQFSSRELISTRPFLNHL